MGSRPNFHTVDIEIAQAILARSVSDSDYWSFKGQATRTGAHAIFHYPAMMVAQMQGELIDIVCAAQPTISSVFDPFVGSGTILVESMNRGLHFGGCDINPLAILTCLAKIGPYKTGQLKSVAADLTARISEDSGRRYAIAFRGQSKWFTKSANEQLSKLRRAIETVDLPWARRLFWVVMAETIRLTSNSRTSTFKLHIKAEKDIRKASVGAVDIFLTLLHDTLDHLAKQEEVLLTNGVLYKGQYQADISLRVEDIRQIDPRRLLGTSFDLIVTSPPYGDNLTTVPYGQFSHLPLQWIPRDDFPVEIGANLFQSSHRLDSASLGGSKAAALVRGDAVSDISASFADCFKLIKSLNTEHGKKLASFCFDFYESLISITNAASPNGISIWTVGNRRVSGIEVPFATILEEMLCELGATKIISFPRRIPSKRMAVRNNTSGTMCDETILVMRMRSNN